MNNTIPPSVPPRTSFVRVANAAKVKELAAEAKRVGYKVTRNEIKVTAQDPENGNAEVFHAIQVRPGYWCVSYPLAYWEEPAPVLPATPANFAKHINNHP